MHTLTQYWNDAWAFFHEGMDHIKPIQGLVIGVLFVLMAGSITSLFILPALAAIVYITADAMIPALVNHIDLALPRFDAHLWHVFLTLYCVYFVAAAVVFGIRTLSESLHS